MVTRMVLGMSAMVRTERGLQRVEKVRHEAIHGGRLIEGYEFDVPVHEQDV